MDHIDVYDRLRTSGYNHEELVFTNDAGHVLSKLSNRSQGSKISCTVDPSNNCAGGASSGGETAGIEMHWGKKRLSVKEKSERSATVLFKGEKEVERNWYGG